jgi:hypothetical protein
MIYSCEAADELRTRAVFPRQGNRRILFLFQNDDTGARLRYRLFCVLYLSRQKAKKVMLSDDAPFFVYHRIPLFKRLKTR